VLLLLPRQYVSGLTERLIILELSTYIAADHHLYMYICYIHPFTQVGMREFIQLYYSYITIDRIMQRGPLLKYVFTSYINPRILLRLVTCIAVEHKSIHIMQ
jgi:hypothetical protein